MNKTVCFTGKRPQAMPWKNDEKAIGCLELKCRLINCIEKLIEQGYTHFISGMALGVDIWAAEIVIALKKEHKNITLEAAIPFDGQADKWSEDGRQRYGSILKNCDKITYTSKAYSNNCFMKRNKYMVDNSSVVVAVYNNTGGGTLNTINYAKSSDKQLIILDF